MQSGVLTEISVNNLRIIKLAKMKPSACFNFFYGFNGSGKTSLLEAIYILSHGKSIRTAKLSNVINHHTEKLAVSSQLLDKYGVCRNAGIIKTKTSRPQLQLDNAPIRSIKEIAEMIPVLMICPDSFALIDGGPRLRRKFLDWGVFHVERAFGDAWKRFQRLLKQRNAALSPYSGFSDADIKIWDVEYADLSEQIAVWHEAYIKAFTPILLNCIESLSDNLPEIELKYQLGWPDDNRFNLKECLDQSFIRDRKLGYTTLGPHRADIDMKVDGYPAKEVLSRGQQKLLAYALYLAQGQYLREVTGKNCIYLLDDLPAELDSIHQRKVLELLKNLGSQVFITALEKSAFLDVFDASNSKLFHVERGNITELEPEHSLVDVQ